MPVKPNREYRSAATFEAPEIEEYIVEGYASTFAPYVMMSYDGVDYWERIEPRAFDEANMDDVIMQYDHEGRVYARKSNGTLEVTVDEHGLKVRADLSKTAAARALYDEIKAGMIKEMSFAFTVKDERYDKDTHTRVIEKVDRIYDVSAVSIPANPDTQISARSYFDGVIEMEKQELLEAEEREKQKSRIRILMEVSK